MTERERMRRRRAQRILKLRLRFGVPATHSRDGRKYAPGPHRTHQPHEIKQDGMVLNGHGVPVPHVFRVLHPGTLVKQ